MGYAGYLIVFLANWFSCSFWLTLINVPAHLTMDELEDKDVQDIDFAKTQIAHSRTFSAGSRCMTWLTQGINTQTEHHLFPTVPFKYLMDLTPIIAELCEKHGVKFSDPYISFSEAMRLYVERVGLLSEKARGEGSDEYIDV